jgi:hypothetical protein
MTLYERGEMVKMGETTQYGYDKAGRRVAMRSGNQETRYQYGKNGK